MSAPLRLVLYALTLAVVFAGAFVVGDAVVPESVVTDWVEQTDQHDDEAPHEDVVVPEPTPTHPEESHG